MPKPPKTPEIKALNAAMASRDGAGAVKAIKDIQTKYGAKAADAVIADVVAGGAAELQRRAGKTG